MIRFLPWLMMIITLLFGGCSKGQHSGLITAELSLAANAHFVRQMLTPDIPLGFDSFFVRGEGPADTEFEVNTKETSCSIEDLLPGVWTLSAQGFNSTGLLLAQGSTTTDLSEEAFSAEIQLLPISGTGSLAIDFTWDDRLVQTPVIQISATDPDGVLETLSIVESAGLATVTGTLESGLFVLTAGLFDGETPIAGMADVIAILPDQSTAGSIYLDIALNPIDIGIAANAPRFEPYSIVINGYDPPLFVDNTALLSCTIEDPGVDTGSLSMRWYVDGALAGVEHTFSPETSTADVQRIDLVVLRDDWISGGSATETISIFEPVFYGSMVFIDSMKDNVVGVDGISGIRSLAISPTSGYLFTAGYDEAEIGVFSIDGDTGKPSFVGVVGNSETGTTDALDGVSDVVVSFDSEYLWAVGSGSGSIATFSISPSTGLPSTLQHLRPVIEDFQNVPADIVSGTNTLAGSLSLAVSPDSRFLYSCSPLSHSISVFEFDPLTETLAPKYAYSQLVLGEEYGYLLDAPETIEVSPNGEWAAVACKSSDSILIFTVDPLTGGLSLHQTFTDGINSVDGLNAPTGIAWSLDSKHLYVAGYYDDAVSLFVDESGTWIYQGSMRDDDYPDSPFHYPRGILISPDGTELYVCASGSDALTVFSRDGVAGGLSNPVSAINGEDRLDGLDGMRASAISATGEFLYAAATNDDAVVFFRRDR